LRASDTEGERQGAWHLGTRFDTQKDGVDEDNSGSSSGGKSQTRSIVRPTLLLSPRRRAESLEADIWEQNKACPTPSSHFVVENWPLSRSSCETTLSLLDDCATMMASWNNETLQPTLMPLTGNDSQHYIMDRKVGPARLMPDNLDASSLNISKFVQGSEVLVNGQVQAIVIDSIGTGCFGQQIYEVNLEVNHSQHKALEMSIMLYYPDSILTA